MITPRQTRLHRAANLREFQATIRRLAGHADLSRLRDTFVVFPSSSAADQFRRTLENRALPGRSTSDRALSIPQLVTREGWYDAMCSRLAVAPPRLNALEREVMLNAAAREVAGSDVGAPFKLRAGLLVEMLNLYDELKRRNVEIDTFERLLCGDLERDADIDRGAERLLRQTRFLAASYRGYESRRAATGRFDEAALRSELIKTGLASPIRHVIVTVGERNVDPAGLWPADLDLLTRLGHLERIDIVATNATVAAGLLDRLEKFMPGFEEGDEESENDGGDPALVISETGLWSVSRDREDELYEVARRLKSERCSNLERRAVIFRKPLPYVYLARDVFADGGIPYQTFDALPLAAEPYAAAIDLVIEAVTAEYTREALIALLASPHFRFEVDGIAIDRPAIAALNDAFVKQGYLGGIDRPVQFAEALLAAAPATNVLRAARAAADVSRELAALTAPGQPSRHLLVLGEFLSKHEASLDESDPANERHLRARGALRAALEMLTQAHEHIDDSLSPFTSVAAMLRRWIERQTFSPRTGTAGLQLLDAQSAKYGQFDETFVVGLIEGEWPERTGKNIFYPQSLLSQLDWPDMRTTLAGERAAFHDLLSLPRQAVHLSTFELENDAIVAPTPFLEDLDRLKLRREIAPPPTIGRHFVSEALSMPPVVTAAVSGDASAWLALRSDRSDPSERQFHGTAAPHKRPAYTVSSIERYLECPFRFFSERVLEIEEDPEQEPILTPRELGIFVHGVFQAFFQEWSLRGHAAITPENLPESRAIFGEIVEPRLAMLSPAEAAVQRTRLLGSAADEGLAEAVFQIEAAWDTPVVERLLEYRLNGEFEISADGETRRIGLKGTADRIDLLADGRFRIIDYKLSRAPDRKLALQLPIYTVCAIQHLRDRRDKAWEFGQAGYIAFGGERKFVPMLARGKTADATLADAQMRLMKAVDAIERGEFPPAPSDIMMCTRCPHAPVCRKDYVGDV